MNTSFRLTHLAASMSLILGSSIIIPSTWANSCTTYSAAGTCGLAEYTMTSPLTPLPTAWYFTTPTQDAAINSSAKAQNIYFASGYSPRGADNLQQLLVDGADLSGYYINASKNGSATITLANNASVDWIEAGGATTNTRVLIDASTLNGANAAVDYDKKTTTPYSKNYARGYAIYLDSSDKGNAEIAIRNGSVVNGRILAGGAGTHNITLQDSRIQAGSILLYNATNNNSLSLRNSSIDTTQAIVATADAIALTNLAKSDKTQAIILDNSRLTGSVSVNSSGSTHLVSLADSSISKTTQADGNALSLKGGKTTRLTLSNSQLTGHTVLAGSESITTALDRSLIDGNIIANNAAAIAMEITHSTLNGDINASAGKGSVVLHLTDSRLTGDVQLYGGNVTDSDIWLDNAQVAGHLYGSGEQSTLHLANTALFDGTQFSHFTRLAIAGDTVLSGGFTDANVGNALTVNGNTLTAPVQLSSGKLTLDNTRLIADTLALSSSASLALTQGSQLQTRSDQLFNAAAAATVPEGYNGTGSRIDFSNSTLILTDNAYQLEYVKAVNTLLGETKGNNLVMLGTLQNPEGATGTASVRDASTTGAVLANMQVTSAKNQLVIGTKDAITDDTLHVSNGFGAAQLRFEGEGQPSVDIGGGQALTLTGAAGALFDVSGAPQTPVAVAVNNGTLNLGSAAMPNVTSHLIGTVTVAPQGTMNIVAGDHAVVSGAQSAGVISSGLVNVHPQATLRADVALQDHGQLAVNGSMMTGQLTGNQDAQITVGDSAAAGTLLAERLDLQGARLFIDPSWKAGSLITDASRVASGGHEINGRITLGQNALLVLGDNTTALAEARFADSGLAWGEEGITAAVSLHAPQYLNATQGGLRVDGSLTSSAVQTDAAYNSAEFADHSLLMVSSKEMSNGQAALTAREGTLNVANRAVLYVADAKANQTYTLAKGFSDINIAGHGWQQENLVLNKLLSATTGAQNGDIVVATHARPAQEVLPGIVTPHALDTLIARGENDRNASQAGARYLSVAIDTPQVGVEQVVKTVNSAAQIATAGGVQRNTWAAGAAAVDAVLERTSAAHTPLRRAAPEAEVWVNVLYGNPRSSGLQASNLHYGQTSDFYGLMLGADKARETAFGTLRSGGAFHAGNGDSDSRGDVNATHNDFSFWGITLYQSWQQAQWNVTGDVSLTQTSSDLTQRQPGWMAAGDKLRASVDGSVFSAGLRGEYLIETRAVDIIPHAGLRYNQLRTAAFDTKNSQKAPVFHTDKDTQHLWQFPVGVKLAKTFALDSGWHVRPHADAGVVTVTGDRDSNNQLHTVGIAATDMIRAEVLDETAFSGQLGVKARKGNTTFGLGYNLNASQHQTDQTLSASWSLAF